MAINFTTLFNRIGKGAYLLGLVDEFRGATGAAATSYIATDLLARWSSFIVTYDGDTPPIRAAVDGWLAALAAGRDGLSGISQAIKDSFGTTIVEMLDADVPLTSKQLPVAVGQLIAQMKTGAKTINANATSCTPAAGGSNHGNGVILASILGGDGLALEYVYAETLLASIASTATVGSETFSVLGKEPAGLLDWNWPLGSGSAQSVTSIDAAAGTNLLTNGSFDTFTVANIPDNWEIVTGNAGTDVFSEPTVVYKPGGKSLRLHGDGATLVQVRQLKAGLASRTPYAVNLWCRVDSAPGAGVLRIDLHDGTSVINDDAGTPNSFSINLVTLGTAFVAANAIFRLPDPVPASVYLRVWQSTALSNTKNVYVDHLAMSAMTRQYAGGPYVCFFSGSVNWSTDDVATFVVANDYGGKLQMALWRTLDLPSLGVRIPSNAAGGETILDSVIV